MFLACSVVVSLSTLYCCGYGHEETKAERLLRALLGSATEEYTLSASERVSVRTHASVARSDFTSVPMIITYSY